MLCIALYHQNLTLEQKKSACHVMCQDEKWRYCPACWCADLHRFFVGAKVCTRLDEWMDQTSCSEGRETGPLLRETNPEDSIEDYERRTTD